MKPPVKDKVTIPWMSQREIPAVKLVLSAWRKLRKDPEIVRNVRDLISLCEDLDAHARTSAESAAWLLEKLAAVDARLRKEAKR